jgi:hypothetical protein
MEPSRLFPIIVLLSRERFFRVGHAHAGVLLQLTVNN